MSKKLILTFIAGILLGGGTTWVARSGNSAEPKTSDDTSVSVGVRIEPLFADNMEIFQIYRSFYDSLLASGKLVLRTGDMEILASTCAFFGEVELYLLANARLKDLPEDQRAAFAEHYNRWLADYKHKIQQPFFDKNGVKLEGTWTIPMYPGRRDDLLQEFLQTIPGRPTVQKSRLYDKDDFGHLL